jgi:hypothetical protein
MNPTRPRSPAASPPTSATAANPANRVPRACANSRSNSWANRWQNRLSAPNRSPSSPCRAGNSQESKSKPCRTAWPATGVLISTWPWREPTPSRCAAICVSRTRQCRKPGSISTIRPESRTGRKPLTDGVLQDRGITERNRRLSYGSLRGYGQRIWTGAERVLRRPLERS